MIKETTDVKKYRWKVTFIAIDINDHYRFYTEYFNGKTKDSAIKQFKHYVDNRFPKKYGYLIRDIRFKENEEFKDSSNNDQTLHNDNIEMKPLEGIQLSLFND